VHPSLGWSVQPLRACVSSTGLTALSWALSVAKWTISMLLRVPQGGLYPPSHTKRAPHCLSSSFQTSIFFVGKVEGFVILLGLVQKNFLQRANFQFGKIQGGSMEVTLEDGGVKVVQKESIVEIHTRNKPHSSADVTVDGDALLHEQVQNGIHAASEFTRSKLPGQNLGGQNAEIRGVPQAEYQSNNIVCSGLPLWGRGQNPDVSSLLLNSHGPHLRQKTVVFQNASVYERCSEKNWGTPGGLRWCMQKLQNFQDVSQILQNACQRLQTRHEFPDLPLHWSIANSVMKRLAIPDFESWRGVEPWRGAYGTPLFWRWHAELVDKYQTLKNSRSHLYVVHQSPDPVLFVLDLLLFCLANTFWLCSLHGMLMLSLINESTAPKQLVGVSRQVCDCTKTSIAYVSSVCTRLNQVWVLCAYCALT